MGLASGRVGDGRAAHVATRMPSAKALFLGNREEGYK